MLATGAGKIFAVLLAVQAAFLFGVWQDSYEAGAVLQVHPPHALNQTGDRLDIETLRAYLERLDLAREIRTRFDLEREMGASERPLISRRHQEADIPAQILRFRFRHRSPDVAFGVVDGLVRGIERSWRLDQERRLRDIFTRDTVLMELTLRQFDRQLAAMPTIRDVPVSPVFPGLGSAGIALAIGWPNPTKDTFTLERERLSRRYEEIRELLARPAVASEGVLGWTVLSPPQMPDRPVWPARLDLLLIALVNALVWSVAWVLWRRLSVGFPADDREGGSLSEASVRTPPAR